jgi:hypothetical protein
MSDTKEETGITLAEFKAWLSGVEEMQADDWAPTLVQWRRIRAKFMQIEEDQAPQRRGPIQSYPQQGYFPPADVPPSRPQPLPSSLASTLKTPDIDSSNGYQSSLV